jgi:hypothetical protein
VTDRAKRSAGCRASIGAVQPDRPYRVAPYRVAPYRVAPYRVAPYRVAPYRVAMARFQAKVPDASLRLASCRSSSSA